MKLLLATALCLHSVHYYCQFSLTFGGALNDYGRDVITVSDGYVLTGWTSSFGEGSKDVWLLKVGFDGEQIWSRNFGGNLEDEGNHLIQTPDGGYLITGVTHAPNGATDQRDVFVIKVDEEGIAEWTQTIGSAISDEWGYSGAFDSETGGYWICGYSNTTDNGSQGLVALLDANGDVLIQFEYGGSGNDHFYSLIDLDGGCILAGSSSSFGPPENGEQIWVLQIENTGAEFWESTFALGGNCVARSLSETSDSGFIIGGNSGGTDGTDGECLTLKISEFGGYQWHQNFGGLNLDFGRDVIVFEDGYVTCGTSNSIGSGSSDGILVRYNLDGTEEWSMSYGEGESDELWGATISEFGCIVAVGNTRSFGGLDEDLWILSTTCGGSLDGFGCTDPTACNYNEDSTVDNGTCTYQLFPYNCTGNCVNDDDGNGICDEFENSAPYNPDYDGDGVIDTSDFLQLLGLFGESFNPEPCIN